MQTVQKYLTRKADLSVFQFFMYVSGKQILLKLVGLRHMNNSWRFVCLCVVLKYFVLPNWNHVLYSPTLFIFFFSVNCILILETVSKSGIGVLIVCWWFLCGWSCWLLSFFPYFKVDMIFALESLKYVCMCCVYAHTRLLWRSGATCWR